MAVIFQAGYSLPSGDEPLTHARIAHANNWLSGGTVNASSTATGYFAEGPTNSLTYEKWKPTAPGTWEYDHGGSSECDYCVIGAHTLGTASATFKVQYWNGGAWIDLCAATSPADDEPIMVIFAPQTRQRWRVNISAGTPELGVVKFGSALQMERPLYGEYTPFRFARTTELRSSYSETGEFLGRTKQRKYLDFPITWRQLTRAWVNANWFSAVTAFEAEPFFVASAPGAFDEAALCQVADQIQQPTQQANGFLSASLTVRGYGYG